MGFSHCHLPAVALALPLLLPLQACGAPRENGLLKLDRARMVADLEGQRSEANRLHRELQLAILADREITIGLRADAAVAAQGRRAAQRALQIEERRLAVEQERLQQVESDLAAIQGQLEVLKRMRAEIEGRELEIESLAQRKAALDPQLEAARKDVADLEAALAEKIQLLTQRIATLRAADAAVSQALQAIEAAGLGVVSQPAQGTRQDPPK